MKALTLYQPWATLVAIGAKKIETRSWKTDYRGPLAIHAGKNKKYIDGKNKLYICDKEPFISYLTAYSRRCQWLFGAVTPRGVILATCELVGCYEIRDFQCSSFPSDDGRWWLISPDERAFGDYTSGRFAWLLDNIHILPKPVEMKGSLGLWEWKHE